MNSWKENSLNNYLTEIKKWYSDCSFHSFVGMTFPDNLNGEDLKEFNEILNLTEMTGYEDDIVINKLLEDKTKDNFTFYLLDSNKINVKIDSVYNNKTVFIELANRYLASRNEYASPEIRCLIKRNYKIDNKDINFVNELYPKKPNKFKSQLEFERWSFLRFIVKVKNPDDIELLLSNSNVLYIILSFKLKKPVGYKYPNLLGVANTAIQSYRENGDMILKAIKYYEVNEVINKLDRKKGNFKKKKEQHFDNKPIQNEDFKRIIEIIFPELK